MQYRKNPWICIGQSGNNQGSHWLLNICTGCRIKRRKFNPLTTTSHIIPQVHDISDEDNQKPALDFYERHGNPIRDARLAYTTITSHSTDIKEVDEIGVINAGVWRTCLTGLILKHTVDVV